MAESVGILATWGDFAAEFAVWIAVAAVLTFSAWALGQFAEKSGLRNN